MTAYSCPDVPSAVFHVERGREEAVHCPFCGGAVAEHELAPDPAPRAVLEEIAADGSVSGRRIPLNRLGRRLMPRLREARKRRGGIFYTFPPEAE